MHILGLLALLIQCSPFRTCVLEELALGSSCHSEVAVAEHDVPPTTAADGCPSHGASHDPSCVCERPKFSVERMAHVTAIPAVAIPVVLLPFEQHAVSPCYPTYDTLAAANPPPLARCTPLVI